MSDLTFIQTLVIGSYVWTFVVGVGLWKLIERRFTTLAENHLHHLEAEVRRLASETRTPSSATDLTVRASSARRRVKRPRSTR